jgi:hypothetical protein
MLPLSHSDPQKQFHPLRPEPKKKASAQSVDRTHLGKSKKSLISRITASQVEEIFRCNCNAKTAFAYPGQNLVLHGRSASPPKKAYAIF